MRWLGSLAPRDLRAFIALLFSILGTVALTAFAVWIVWILWRGGWPHGTELARIDKIGLIGVLVVTIMGLSMAGLQLAINRRTLRANIGAAGFEASGGDDPTTPLVAAAAAGASAGVTAAAATSTEPKP